MLVFLDTNVLVSAALNPHGTPARAFDKAVASPNRAVTSRHNLDELERIFTTKLAKSTTLLESFLQLAAPALTVIDVPADAVDDEAAIRDIADRPILRTARAVNADVLVTGDKDFLEAGLRCPRIVTPADFLAM